MARLPKRVPSQAAVKKVRFCLPADSASDDDIEEEKEQPNVPDKKAPPNESKQDESKVHGTAKYINGTLNFCRNDYKAAPADPKLPPKKPKKEKKARKFANVMTFPRSALASNSQRPIESPVCSDYWTKAFNGCKVIYQAPTCSPASPTNDPKKNRQRTRIRSCTTILFSPTKCIRRSGCFRNGNKKKFKRLPNELKVPAPHSTPRRLRTRWSSANQFISLFRKSKIASKTNKISMQVILLNRNVPAAPRTRIKSFNLSILIIVHLLGNQRPYITHASLRSGTRTAVDRSQQPNGRRVDWFRAQMEPVPQQSVEIQQRRQRYECYNNRQPFSRLSCLRKIRCKQVSTRRWGNKLFFFKKKYSRIDCCWFWQAAFEREKQCNTTQTWFGVEITWFLYFVFWFRDLHLSGYSELSVSSVCLMVSLTLLLIRAFGRDNGKHWHRRVDAECIVSFHCHSNRQRNHFVLVCDCEVNEVPRIAFSM